jgi:uncharacterized membrane protein YoaK (UPF0700 family)
MPFSSLHDRPKREMEHWVIAGGCALTFLSATANAGFLIELGTSVSHLTGDVSKVAVEFAQGTHRVVELAMNLLVATLSFLLGATMAGYAIHHPSLEISRPYGRAVMVIGLCMLMAHAVLSAFPLAAIGVASFACGFQNALATHYRGMILRTTHITGLLTDLGTNLGMTIRGHDIARWKILIPLFLVLSFFLGSALGAVLVIRLHAPFLLVVASLYVAGGLSWSIYKHWFSPKMR